jgi:hypothetical protein
MALALMRQSRIRGMDAKAGPKAVPQRPGGKVPGMNFSTILGHGTHHLPLQGWALRGVARGCTRCQYPRHHRRPLQSILLPPCSPKQRSPFARR